MATANILYSVEDEEETHFLRFLAGLLNVTTRALRDFFNRQHPNLSADLHQNRVLLNSLKNKVITGAQWNLLFPASGIYNFVAIFS